MATRCDLNGILEGIRGILAAANTTTASPIDLSQDITRRVQKILKVHPAMIPPQASYYPYVTCFVDDKTIDIEKGTIAKDQLQSRRAATPTITIVGGVFNQNHQTPTEDPASKDIYTLMENIELALRSDPTLNATVKWHYPTSVQYFSGVMEDKTHLRSGVMSLKVQIMSY
jgi:hypothetical protein